VRQVNKLQTFEAVSTDSDDIMSVFCFLSSTFTPLFPGDLASSHSELFDGFRGECCADRFCGRFFDSFFTCNFAVEIQQHKTRILQGVPEKNAHSLCTPILQLDVTESCGFQQNVETEIVYMIKDSV